MPEFSSSMTMRPTWLCCDRSCPSGLSQPPNAVRLPEGGCRNWGVGSGSRSVGPPLSHSAVIALLDNIRHELTIPELPIVVITADASTTARMAALEAGATDFLLKPIDTFEVSLRVRNLLRLRKLHRELSEQAASLELRVAERTTELAASQREILERLALASEYRDDMTGRHTERVGVLSVRIAHELQLLPDEIEIIRFAAPLHDIGKIAIPDHILLKPGPLTRSRVSGGQAPCDGRRLDPRRRHQSDPANGRTGRPHPS